MWWAHAGMPGATWGGASAGLRSTRLTSGSFLRNVFRGRFQYQPPVARKDLQVSSTSHGQVLQDEYRWMHKRSMETKWYMGKEYRFTESYFAQKQVQRLAAEYLSELRAAESVTIEGCPELAYGYFYYSRERKGKNFPQYFRKEATSARFEEATAPEELVLDINEEGQGHKFISVSSFELSPSQELISFSKDVEGNEEYSVGAAAPPAPLA